MKKIQFFSRSALFLSLFFFSPIFYATQAHAAAISITGVAVTNITKSSATIGWMTSGSASSSDSVVHYGTSTSLLQFAARPAATTTHSIVISGLTPNSLYYYQVESTSSLNNDATSSIQSFFMTQNLVGYWTFDEGVGTTTFDQSGNGYDAAVGSSTSWVPLGMVAGAMGFNGQGTGNTAALVEASNVYSGLASGTISAWVDVTTSTPGNYIFFSADSGSCKSPFRLSVNPGSGNFLVLGSNNGGCTQSTAQFYAQVPVPSLVNNWHLLTYVVSSTGNLFYVNGAKISTSLVNYSDGSATSTFFFANAATSSDRYVIGGERNNSATNFFGNIDDVRVYNQPLTSAQVMALYNYQTAPPSIQSFMASPTSTASGAPSTLSWATTGATSVAISPGSFATSSSATQGAFIVEPTSTTVYTLTASNSIGSSTASTTETITSFVPSIPQNVTSTSFTSSSVYLSWSSSTEGGNPVAGYNIFLNDLTNPPIATTTVTTYFATGLTPSTTYTYYITAFDASGTSSGFSAPVSVTTQATGTIPSNYVSLNNELQGYINGFNTQLAGTSWSGNLYPVNYSSELLTANGNNCPCGIPGASTTNQLANINEELNRDQAIGQEAATVQVGWPLFDQNFYQYPLGLNENTTTAEASVADNVSFYQQVQQLIHNHGMKMIAKVDPEIPATNPVYLTYFSSLDFPTMESRWSHDNIVIASSVVPDFMNLEAEPGTTASSFITASNTVVAAYLNNPASNTAMIAQFVSDLDGAGITGLHTTLQIGAGASPWTTSWLQYVTGDAAIPDLDIIDTHMYNLENGVSSSNEFALLLQTAAIAQAATSTLHPLGKGFGMDEVWPHSSDQLVGGTPNGSDPVGDVQARDTMSFWSPLDQSFLSTMIQMANYTKASFLSFFGQGFQSTYLDYNSLPCIPFYPQNGIDNTTCSTAITTAQGKAFNQALQATTPQLSDFGKAYQQDIVTYSFNPPIISNLAVTNVTSTSATISWTTNVSSTGDVYFWKDIHAQRIVSSSTPSTTHSFNLGSLTSSSLYYYEVESTSSITGTSTVRDATSSLETFFTTPNLVGYWPLDDGLLNGATTTNVVDDSGNDYDGTAASTTWGNGEIGGAAYFNGSSSQTSNIALNAQNLFNNLATGTIAAWINWDGVATSSITIFSGDSGACKNPFNFGMQNGSFIVTNNCGTPSFKLGTNPIANASNTWHDLVYTSSGAGSSMYVDGQLAISTTTSFFIASSTAATTTPFNYTIGDEYKTANKTFSGAIDDVRIYNRVLPASEVYSLYNQYSLNPPVLSNILVTNVTTSTAAVSWMTDVPTDGNVYYGTSTAVNQIVDNQAPSTTHSFALSGLASNTLYYYELESTSTAPVTSTIRDATSSLETFFTTPGLVGYWPLDDGILNGATTTNVVDDSGNDYDGTAASTTWGPGYIGGAAYFNGSSSQTSNILINTQNIFNNLSAGTIAAWVKWDGGPSSSTAIFSADTGACKTPFMMSIQNMNFMISNGCPSATLKASAPIANMASNTWYGLAYTSGPSGNTLYINGQAATTSYVGMTSTTDFFFASSTVGTTTPFNYTIGDEYNTPVKTFSGGIDEMRVYSRVLSSSEIQTLY